MGGKEGDPRIDIAEGTKLQQEGAGNAGPCFGATIRRDAFFIFHRAARPVAFELNCLRHCERLYDLRRKCRRLEDHSGINIGVGTLWQ